MNAKSESKHKKLPRSIRVIRELVAILLWAYIFVKLFVFDIDNYILAKYAPGTLWMLNWKSFLVLGVFATIIFFTRWKRFTSIVAYIVCYPLILVVWKVPKLLFSRRVLANWPVFVVLAPAAFDFIVSFRINCVLYILAVLSALFLSLFSSAYVVYPASVVLAIVVCSILVRSFWKSYSANMFSTLTRMVKKWRVSIEAGHFDKGKVKGSPSQSNSENATDNNVSRENATLWLLYASYSGAELTADKVLGPATNRRLDLYLLVSWIWIVVVVVFSYSFLYWGLFKVAPDSFSASGQPSWAAFLGYSVSVFTTADLSGIVPSGILARVVSHTELLCMLATGVILFFTILTAAREKYQEDIRELLDELRRTAAAVTLCFQQAYELAIDEVEMLLLSDSASLVNGLRKMRSLPALTPPEQLNGDATDDDNGQDGDEKDGSEADAESSGSE